MQVREENGEVEVLSFELTEEFSCELLGRSYLKRLKVEHGCIVIIARNGTWRYLIEDFTFDGHTVIAELVSYKR